ncbi:MAG: FadR family transcriptional regulator [Desulfovibrio sp.]|jgi:DNA-binding FadR family transcriptional regulator|nr:FadR family transcriptional regulator [Desulfovibrio sp.]
MNTIANNEPRRIVRRRQLVDEVISGMHELLASGGYKEGDKIPTESQLGDMFTVSRTTVREAIKVLANTGMLEVQQGRGTFVARRAPGKEPLENRLVRAREQDVYEARLLLETDIARLAAQRRSEADLHVMRRCMEECEAAFRQGDAGRYLSYDAEFHVAMAEACKNAILLDVYVAFSDALRDSLRRRWERDAVSEDRRAGMLAYYRELYQAICDREPDKAAAAAAAYIGQMYTMRE